MILNRITIRRATSQDFETIYGFINLLEAETFDRSAQEAIFGQNIKEANIWYLLAVDGEQPVGFLSCHIQQLLHHGGKIGEIQEMYVSESARNLGIGKRLMDYVKAIALKENVLQLEVSSNVSREAAHRFYLRENFIFTHKKFTLKFQ